MTIDSRLNTLLYQLTTNLQQDNSEPPLAPSVSSSTSSSTPLLPLLPWLVAQLGLGLIGYIQYDVGVNDYVDAMYLFFKTFAEALAAMGGLTVTYTREEFDSTVWLTIKTTPLVLGHKRARIAGFSSAGIGLFGTATAFLLGSGPLFNVLVAYSLLPAIFMMT